MARRQESKQTYEEFLDQLEEDDPIAHEPIFVISMAAELAGMHPQTLRQYDRMGMVVPSRQGGGQRRYSAADVLRLRRIQKLSRDGVSLEGIRRVVELEYEVEQLRQTVAFLVDQVDVLHRQGRFSRTFTAGSRGDVITDFSYGSDAQYVPAQDPTAGATSDHDGDVAPTGETGYRFERKSLATRRQHIQRALGSKISEQKVLMWRRHLEHQQQHRRQLED